MRIHFAKGMLKAFLLSSISLNSWAANHVPAANCTNGVAPSCDRSAAGLTTIVSPGASSHDSLPPSSGASTESDSSSDTGSDTGSSVEGAGSGSDSSLSLYAASPGRLPATAGAAPSTVDARLMSVLAALSDIDDASLLTTGAGAMAMAPTGMPLPPGLLTPSMVALSAGKFQVVRAAPGVTVMAGVPGLEHLTATAFASNPAAGALLVAYPETLRWAKGLFIPVEPAAPDGEVLVPSFYAKKITTILDNVPVLELDIFVRQVESIRSLLPKVFKNDVMGTTLHRFMSAVSSTSTQAERALLVAQLKWIHSLDPKALDHEAGSHALIRLTKAMAPIPGAKRVAILKNLQDLLDKSLDKIEVITLTFEMPDTHIVPVVSQVKRFTGPKLPSRNFGPILQVIARHFDPANPKYIEQIIGAAMHVTRKERSSEDHAHIIEGFAQIPLRKIAKIKENIRLLEKPHMSGDDIRIIVQALAKGNMDHMEKVVGYTTTMVHKTMSAKGIGIIISSFYTLLSRADMSEADVEAISHQSKPLLQAMESFGKIKYSETYGHVLERVAALPLRIRKAIIGEALRYLAHPTEYHRTLPKRTEDAVAQWTPTQSRLEVVAAETIRLQAVAKEKKAAAEAAVKEWEDHLPIIEEYATHEKKLNDIRITALESQLNEETVIQLLEEDMPKLSAYSQKLQQESIESHKARLAKYQKTVREALHELSMAATAKKIAMDVLEELKLDSGKKSTAAADAARQASISFKELKAVADKVEELEVARNSTEAIRLVDAIFIPERVLGRKVVQAGPTRYEEDEYAPGFLEAYSEPKLSTNWPQLQAAAMSVSTIEPDYAYEPKALPRTLAEEYANTKAWKEATGEPWTAEDEAAWRKAHPLPMRRSDY